MQIGSWARKGVRRAVRIAFGTTNDRCYSLPPLPFPLVPEHGTVFTFTQNMSTKFTSQQLINLHILYFSLNTYAGYHD